MNRHHNVFSVCTLIAAASVLPLSAMGPDTGTGEAPKAPVAKEKPALQIPPTPVPATKPRVQIALLLDTSSSMQGLLNQAKTRLWKIVNEFVLARRGELRPDFEVALYEYGNKTLVQASGFVRKVSPLTDDLDKISEELFGLKIMSYGSQEYCGRAIQAAASELEWSPVRDDLKVIFIAGNESFAQGDRDYREACKTAITRGVVVNTIFCGSHSQGVGLGWKDGALRGEGTYASIDQNRTVVYRATPLDKQIADLGIELNKTYVPYGPEGKQSQRRQVSQDRNAEAESEGATTRAVSKGSALYKNASWDLVDAIIVEKKLALKDVKDKDLPEAMRKMSAEERKKFLEDKAKQRNALQSKISTLNANRKKLIEVRKTAKDAGQETLDSAMIRALRELAKKKGFQFKSPAVPPKEEKIPQEAKKPRIQE